MSAKPERRRFTTAYKLTIIAEAARCTRPGESAALLRREGLYSSHLAAWRAAERRGDHPGRPRGGHRRGPKEVAALLDQRHPPPSGVSTGPR